MMTDDGYYSVGHGCSREPDGFQPDVRCSWFYCQRVADNRCCSVCPRLSRCIEPCLNSPDRCGLVSNWGAEE